MDNGVNDDIQRIIVERGVVAKRVNELSEHWKKRKARIKTLGACAKEMRDVCQRAIGAVQGGEREDFQELLDYLEQLDGQQFIRDNEANAAYALGKLLKLSERFNRSTLNIAVAGVGRCGKSTALKSIIGQTQNANTVIPSGNGTAVTAGKSTIRCVQTKEEEKTVITYHTQASFLGEVINPLLEDLALNEKTCDSLEDFSRLEYEELRTLIEKKKEEAEQRVREAERQSEQDRMLASAYASSFNQKIERLSHLGDIIKSYSSFFTRLNGERETVPIETTYRYVSYPKNGEPAICYAVKDCTIYSRFPNNTVQSLQLVDLPGLGTGSLSERKCFLEGFNFTVDLALIIRRPEGLFQNFTTDDDLNVIQVIEATFGGEHLHQCAVMLQNDANLPQADVEAAFGKIQDWNSGRKHPIAVLRGNAFDSEDMQRRILPEILDFIRENLPVLDNSLLDECVPELEKLGEELDRNLLAVENKLQSMKRNFRSGDSNANDVLEQAESIRNNIVSGLDAIMEYYANDFERKSILIPNRRAELTKKLRYWAEHDYDIGDARQLEAVGNEIRRAKSAVPFANAELHAIRIHITEVYSELEQIHQELIREMQAKVANLFEKCMPALFEGKNMDMIMDDMSKAGDCPEIVKALKALMELEIPFYNTIYPDLRAEAFEDVDKVSEGFHFDVSLPVEKRAGIALQLLQDKALNWIYKADTVLNSQSRIKAILLAVLARLQDRLGRNRTTKRELNDFVEHFWSEINRGKGAYSHDIRGKLDKITN